ncbi:MAG TPA: hypothetical protein VGL70_20000 [Candidatus Binatia bacterium]|jgi:hypothetical protein
MADEKTPPAEEVKWWIDRGPVKEREKAEALGRGIIEKWTYELLKDYKQEQAVRNVVDINPRTLKELSQAPLGWNYVSLGVGSYPADKLDKIKQTVQLPAGARALLIDAGYSVRLLITGEPVGERLIDVNFTEGPSLDYWVNNELIEEKLFRSVDAALQELRSTIRGYLTAPKLD